MSIHNQITMNTQFESFARKKEGRYNDDNDDIKLAESAHYFGIVKLDVNASEITRLNQHIVITMDRSASMSDLVESDNKTKMQHILFTLENMMRFFANLKNGPNVSFTVFAFDDVIESIFEDKPINAQNLAEHVNTIKEQIYPRGATNIELALSNASIYISKYAQDNPTTVVTHFMMTDGDANCGSTNPTKLKTYVSGAKTHGTVIFGFGTTHNSEMLSTITSDNANGSAYYFIDQLENSGSVYGQALHKVLYNSISNAELKLENGLVYNWKTNEWVSQMFIGNIGSSEKAYHVVSNCPHQFSATIVGTNIETTAQEVIAIEKREFDSNLMNYKLRQRTLELLFQAIDISVSKKCDGEELTDISGEFKILFDETQEYMETHQLMEDKFLKVLCDDMYVATKTIGTVYGHMYAIARQTSQGEQCVYNVTRIPYEVDARKQFLYGAINTNCGDIIDNDDEEEEEEYNHKGAIDASSSIFTFDDIPPKPLELKKGYALSDSIDSPYTGDLRAVKMMRSLTCGDAPLNL